LFMNTRTIKNPLNPNIHYQNRDERKKKRNKRRRKVRGKEKKLNARRGNRYEDIHRIMTLLTPTVLHSMGKGEIKKEKKVTIYRSKKSFPWWVGISRPWLSFETLFFIPCTQTVPPIVHRNYNYFDSSRLTAAAILFSSALFNFLSRAALVFARLAAISSWSVFSRAFSALAL